MIVRKEFLRDSSSSTLLHLSEYCLFSAEDFSLPEARPEEEIVLILEGDGQYRAGDLNYSASPGDIFLFPRGEQHCLTRVEPETDLRLLRLRFDPRFICSGGENPFDWQYLSVFRSGKEDFVCRLPRNAACREEAGRLLLQIREEMFSQPERYELMTRALLLQLLTLLLRSESGSRGESLPQLSPGILRDLERGIRYIDENFTEDLSLTEICREAGMSKSYFLKLFKQLNGIAPWEYLTLKRVSHSVQLLQRSGMTVLEIAMRSGFNSKSSYNRAFLRVMQKTPTEYRAALRRNERYGIGMLTKYHLAVDIGASGGRLILGGLEDGRIVLEEVYRFENHMVKKDGRLCWDYDSIFSHVLQGLKQCRSLGKIPVTMGIDTWGVDYVLLDENDRVIGETYAYRDSRSGEAIPGVFARISESCLYAKTGIQRQPFNTVFQLFARQEDTPEHLRQAKAFLMVPEYLNFRLTGVKKNEYTNATTTGMVNVQTKTWDPEILSLFDCSPSIFGPLYLPGTEVGSFTAEIAAQVGFQCRVLLPPTHDTASAVLAVPAVRDDVLYISSGTWSLMGVETMVPITGEESRKNNFTNEGGYGFRYRYLCNIMGLWMIQSVRRELGSQYGFSQLSDLARNAGDFASRVAVNDPRFLAPDSMSEAVRNYCSETDQPVPQTVGELMRCIYLSLADSYRDTAEKMKRMTGREFCQIHVVGGGSRDEYLDQLTAEACGIPVLAGPAECTALGNLTCQMIADGKFSGLTAARQTIAQSFHLKEYGGTEQ